MKWLLIDFCCFLVGFSLLSHAPAWVWTFGSGVVVGFFGLLAWIAWADHRARRDLALNPTTPPRKENRCA